MDPKLTASEYIQALCLYREARGQTKDAKAAVLAVIRNRAAQSPKFGWPSSVVGVIIQPYQFSSFNPSDPNAKVWPGLGDSPGQWQAWCDCASVVLAPPADPTNGANHYESVADPALRPSWAESDKITLTVGPFRFYRL